MRITSQGPCVFAIASADGKVEMLALFGSGKGDVKFVQMWLHESDKSVVYALRDSGVRDKGAGLRIEVVLDYVQIHDRDFHRPGLSNSRSVLDCDELLDEYRSTFVVRSRR